MTLYVWDEITCELNEAPISGLSLDEYESDEGLEGGWTKARREGPILVERSERGHLAILIEAPSHAEALAMLAQQQEYTEWEG